MLRKQLLQIYRVVFIFKRYFTAPANMNFGTEFIIYNMGFGIRFEMKRIVRALYQATRRALRLGQLRINKLNGAIIQALFLMYIVFRAGAGNFFLLGKHSFSDGYTYLLESLLHQNFRYFRYTPQSYIKNLVTLVMANFK